MSAVAAAVVRTSPLSLFAYSFAGLSFHNPIHLADTIYTGSACAANCDVGVSVRGRGLCAYGPGNLGVRMEKDGRLGAMMDEWPCDSHPWKL